MKFPLSWLHRYLDTTADAATIADALTRLGLEVESVTNPADRLSAFRIARVLTAAPHPQADKLQVLTVDPGNGVPPLQVVCGAPNARAGLVGVFGPAGATVPANGMVLKVASIRGVESNGMMCSARELELGDDHDGIIELGEDAPVGQSFAPWAGLDDPVFDVAITPNRQDCMGVHGIARDLAAAGLGTLKPLALPAIPTGDPCPVPIATEDREGCPAFFARAIFGVSNGPSPEWLQRLLTRAGLRPISALVDITNYFSIGHGRPLHVYDIARLTGGLTARRARAGETLLALNGRTYTLDETMTVIADDVQVHDIGGIMGGMDSGVSEATTDVLIEAAFFDPARIGATGRALGLASDARARFERGVDPAFVAPALDMAAAMVAALCGGRISAPAIAGTVPDTRRTIAFDPAHVMRLAGIAVPADRQRSILAALGFAVPDGQVPVAVANSAGRAPWEVAVPSWRRDVHGPADLVEEVVRLTGLDQVQSVPLPRAEGVARPTATPLQKLERRLRRLSAARGYAEAITWSFIHPSQAERFGTAHWLLENPLSAELAAMRPSLLPGLVAAASRNAARAAPSIRLFELGRCYLASGEHPALALLLAGEASPRTWRHGKARPASAFDLKADLMALLAAAGIATDRLQTVSPAAPHYHPGQSARLMLGKNCLAEFGTLHPTILAAADLSLPTVAAELFLDALPERRARLTRAPFTPSPLQPVIRDFAFVAPEGLAAEALVRAVRNADKALIAEASLFDRFVGRGVPEGQVSLAIAVTLQPTDRTLTDTDLDAVSSAIVAAAARLGATLRA